MRFVAIASAFCAAGLFGLGFSRIVPIGGGLDTLCDLAGVASALLLLGLFEGA